MGDDFFSTPGRFEISENNSFPPKPSGAKKKVQLLRTPPETKTPTEFSGVFLFFVFNFLSLPLSFNFSQANFFQGKFFVHIFFRSCTKIINSPGTTQPRG